MQAIYKKSFNTVVNATQSSETAIENTILLKKFIDELDCFEDSSIDMDQIVNILLKTRSKQRKKVDDSNELGSNKAIKFDKQTPRPEYLIITPNSPKPELIYPIITPNSPKPEVVLLSCNKN